MDYREFLGALNPIFLGLDSSSCSINRDAYWSPKNVRRVLSSKYSLTVLTDDYFDVEGSFSASLQWAAEDGPIVQAMKIECVFTGHFHTNSPVDKEHVKKFVDEEAWLMFWPYFRQFVSDTTSRMSIPPVVVPLALGPGEHSHVKRIAPSKQLSRRAKTHKSTKRLK